MSDSQNQPIGPVAKVANVPAVQPVRNERPALLDQSKPASRGQSVAAVSTGGGLPGAYAQLVVNQDTNDVVIRVLDSATNRVISEFPSTQVEELAKYMKTYEETLARHRAAVRPQTAS
jgi:hypothetical protein